MSDEQGWAKAVELLQKELVGYQNTGIKLMQERDAALKECLRLRKVLTKAIKDRHYLPVGKKRFIAAIRCASYVIQAVIGFALTRQGYSWTAAWLWLALGLELAALLMRRAK